MRNDLRGQAPPRSQELRRVRGRSKPSRTFAVPAFPELMPDYANAFTAVELERLLDWFQRLRICRADVPRDYELGDKVARELARLRRPVDQP